SFTSQSSSPSTSLPIQSQSLSCVLLLTDDIIKQQQLIRPLSILTILISILSSSLTIL
ncbi:unnamed protein product, partial [Rotaria sp. Silwood2]